MHTQGSFLIAAEGKRAVHKIPSSPAASTRESGKGGRLGGETLPFAAGCLNSHTADEPDLAGPVVIGRFPNVAPRRESVSADTRFLLQL